ncbi:heme-binding domain-containing protein [Flavobacteriaceae bacterium F08102]|nr:heme-binding domain-containing protein [Flavobacteriaceae bacterium F08102]
MLKKIFILFLVAVIVIQFFPPEKNDSNDQKFAISTVYTVNDPIKHMLDVACNDCHSNKTNYPWYAEIQPVSWWLSDHIKHGKDDLNFSEFTNLPLAIQYHKFEEIVEKVEKKQMPLESYTKFGLHPDANLTSAQREELIDWAKAQMTYMKATYPADSLVRKRRRKS